MTFLRIVADSWLSRIYLLYVVAIGAIVTHSMITWDQPDANMAGVGIIFATAPGSFIITAFPDVDSDAAAIVLIVACAIFGALLNAAAINGIVKLLHAAAGHLRRHHQQDSAAA
jgi:hypothetical protein